MIISNKRIEYIDFIKGCCIFLVVWAHSIQNLGPENAFWENPAHIFISSFHMPIFMLISGFFFNRSLHLSLKEITKKKFIQLIVPCFGWSLILVLLHSIEMFVSGVSISFLGQIKQLFYETGTRFWFLRSVFICYIYAFISLKLFKKDYIAFIVSFIFFLLISDNFRLALDKFMYPYFWFGYFLNKYIDIIDKNRNVLLPLFGVFFIFLLFHWKNEFYIYVTGMSFYSIEGARFVFFPLKERLYIVLFRYMIGLCGSMFFFLLLKSAFTPNIVVFRLLKEVGKYTLGIYVIHIFIEGMILKQIDLPKAGSFSFNFVVTPLISVLLIMICIVFIKVLQKNKFSNFLFLGIAYPPKRMASLKN